MGKGIPGIYMFRNKINGKVYIGQTKDLRARISLHRRDAIYDGRRGRTSGSPIIQALRSEGWDNFEFIILEQGGKCESSEYRHLQETLLMEKYKSYDPKYGYNVLYKPNEDGEKALGRDMHMIAKRLNNAFPVIAYDTDTGRSMLYLSGAAAFASDVGYDRSIITRNIQRGSLIKNRYYVFYVDHDRRHAVIDNIRRAKAEQPVIQIKTITDPNGLHAAEGRRRAMQALDAYLNVAEKMDKIVKEYGY